MADHRTAPGSDIASDEEGAAGNSTVQRSVVVVGSCNVDFVVSVPQLPRPGETVLGADHRRLPGGKGANQAVAAALLGSSVALVACVGDDELADVVERSLVGAGVDLSRLRRSSEAPTGIALISVDASGENHISVSPGANARLSREDVAAAEKELAAARVTLVQLEIPIDVVAAATDAANGSMVVLNAAPAIVLPDEVLCRTDVLVANRSELAALTGREEPTSIGEAARIATDLTGPEAVVVTLGSDGALVVSADGAEYVPAVAVRAVDTTGAGDVFCGALADELARGATLADATRWAVRAAGISTTRWGARAGMPTRRDVEAHVAGSQVLG